MSNTYKRDFQPDGADRRLMLSTYLLGLLFLALFIPFQLGVNVPVFLTCVYIVAFNYQNARTRRSTAAPHRFF